MTSPIAFAAPVEVGTRFSAAAARDRNAPVHSRTTSTSRSAHGNAAGSASAKVGIARPSTTIEPSEASTCGAKRPKPLMAIRRDMALLLSRVHVLAEPPDRVEAGEQSGDHPEQGGGLVPRPPWRSEGLLLR